MTKKDWYVGRDEEFEVEVLLDVDGERKSRHRYMVEEWIDRFGFEELRTFEEEDAALNFAKNQARRTKGRYRVLRASEGKSFEVLNG